MAAAVASSAAVPRLLSIETLPHRTPQSPALLAVRSDGLLLLLGSTGTALSALYAGVEGVVAAVRGGGSLAVLSASRLVLVDLARREQTRECAAPRTRGQRRWAELRPTQGLLPPSLHQVCRA